MIFILLAIVAVIAVLMIVLMVYFSKGNNQGGFGGDNKVKKTWSISGGTTWGPMNSNVWSSNFQEKKKVSNSTAWVSRPSDNVWSTDFQEKKMQSSTFWGTPLNNVWSGDLTKKKIPTLTAKIDRPWDDDQIDFISAEEIWRRGYAKIEKVIMDGIGRCYLITYDDGMTMNQNRAWLINEGIALLKEGAVINEEDDSWG